MVEVVDSFGITEMLGTFQSWEKFNSLDFRINPQILMKKTPKTSQSPNGGSRLAMIGTDTQLIQRMTNGTCTTLSQAQD